MSVLTSPPNRPPATIPAPPSPRHLLGLEGADPEWLRGIIARARELLPHASGLRPPLAILQGRTVATLFFEPSTRTRTSFTLAAQRLGAGVVDLPVASSSVGKGESIADTGRNLHALGVHAIVIRSAMSGAAHVLARAVPIPVINAGDGRHEHPTQGLLDIAALSEALRRPDPLDLGGLHVVIVGDIISSRVARSAVHGLSALGARVTLVGPPAMAPRSLELLVPGTRVRHELDPELPDADAVMMLRIQFERHTDALSAGDLAPRTAPIASAREYRALYALTAERAARLRPNTVVMHPGPINRGIELDADVADSARSIILRQVTWGVAVRAAVLGECVAPIG